MNAIHDSQASRQDSVIAAAEHWPTPAAVWMGRLLAFSATALSLVVSGLVGWQRGSALVEQVLLAGFGVLAVLGTHWLLPLLRIVPAGMLSRLAGVLLWLACLVYAATSHADFFIGIQAQRANHRIAAVASEGTETMPKRNLPAILEEEAGVRAKWMRARLSEASCAAGCEGLKIRQVELQSRLAALAAEEEEARHWQVTQDRLWERREAARDDPVVARLQRDFGVTPAVASAVTVLPVAVILEGLGALCWCLVLQWRRRLVTSPATRIVTATATMPVASRVTQAADGHGHASPMTEPVSLAVTPSVTPQTAEVVTDEVRHDDIHQRGVYVLAAKVWVEIQQGQVKPTVSSIRAHLGIAQVQARAVARVIRGWMIEGPCQNVGALTPHGVSARLT